MYILSDKKALYPLATETPRTKARRKAEQFTCPRGVVEPQAPPHATSICAGSRAGPEGLSPGPGWAEEQERSVSSGQWVMGLCV